MSDLDSTRQYIECIKAEVIALESSDLSHKEIAAKAVTDCEELATASAQAFVDEMPEEEIRAWHSAGRTTEMILERQKEIGRKAGQQMAIGLLERHASENQPK